MNPFQMLLVLGFPPEIAAATVMPHIFIAGESFSLVTVGQLHLA